MESGGRQGKTQKQESAEPDESAKAAGFRSHGWPQREGSYLRYRKDRPRGTAPWTFSRVSPASGEGARPREGEAMTGLASGASPQQNHRASMDCVNSAQVTATTPSLGLSVGCAPPSKPQGLRSTTRPAASSPNTT